MVAVVIRRFKPTTLMFWVVLGLTLFVWVLRGLKLLGFVPGLFLWALIFACLVLAVVSNIR